MPNCLVPLPTEDDPDRVVDCYFVIDHPGTDAVTWGPPEFCDPGSPPEITLEEFFVEDNPVALTEEELAKAEAYIIENFDNDWIDVDDPYDN